MSKAFGNYLPYVLSGNHLYIAGQLPKKDLPGAPQFFKGKVGGDVSLEEAQQAAQACAKAIVGQLSDATKGDLAQVARIVKINVFVASAPGFTDQPKVANGASDYLCQVFGRERGAHARAAVGVAELPLGVAVEVDAVVELAPPKSKL